MRKLAHKNGMDINEFNDFIKDKPEYDKEVDDQIVELASKREKLVIISRTAWHFAADSFKVYLYVEENIGAKRILLDGIRIGEEYDTVEEALAAMYTRFDSENERYNTNYGIDVTIPENYDLYLDTSYLTKHEVIDTIEKKYNNHLNPKGNESKVINLKK